MKWSWDKFIIKLTSRKFWAALAGTATIVMATLGYSEIAVEQAAVIISALGLLAVFVLGECYVDGKNCESGRQAAQDDITDENTQVEEMAEKVYQMVIKRLSTRLKD